MNKFYKIVIGLVVLGLLGRFALTGYILVSTFGMFEVVTWLILLPLIVTITLSYIHKKTIKIENKSLKKGLKDVKEGKVTRYKYVEDIFKEQHKWNKEHPIKYKVQQTYYSIRRFFVKIIDFFKYDIKYFIQRGKRGWSDRDWWNYSFYMSTITVGCLKKLKKDGHGLPTWEEGKSEKQAKKEWNDILDNIIYTFETSVKIGDGDVDYISTTQKDKEKFRRIFRRIHKKSKIKYPDLPETKVLTEKESLKFEKGFDLFKKWFFHLWD